MDYEKKIDIPFGAHDSELKGWEYTIPEGFTAEIKDGKVIVREKESEDERIRKWLLECVENLSDGNFIEVSKQDVLFYLEKKKEQKPVEWSEEDREMLTRCVAAIPVQGDEILPTSYLNKLRNWLGYLPERFNLQPKQEWSEEDEKILDSLIRLYSIEYSEYVCPWANGDITYGDVVNFLKSLRPQSKTTEWSDDDEKRIQSILFSIGYCKDEYPNKKDYSKDIDWLKSLRPFWKPSDEQMQCLLAVITNQYNAGAESCHLTLGSLYNDLKKLI